MKRSVKTVAGILVGATLWMSACADGSFFFAQAQEEAEPGVAWTDSWVETEPVEDEAPEPVITQGEADQLEAAEPEVAEYEADRADIEEPELAEPEDTDTEPAQIEFAELPDVASSTDSEFEADAVLEADEFAAPEIDIPELVRSAAAQEALPSIREEAMIAELFEDIRISRANAYAATTNAVSNRGIGRATLNGTFAVLANDLEAEVYFVYGLSQTTLNEIAMYTGTIYHNVASVNIGVGITGLKPKTRYYYQLVVKSGDGLTIKTGNVLNFETNAGPSLLQTYPADLIRANFADLKGRYEHPGGVSPDKYFFQIREVGTEAWDDYPPINHAIGANANRTRSVWGLEPDTLYEFRLVAEYQGATVVGNTVQFRTEKMPEVTVMCELIDETCVELEGHLIYTAGQVFIEGTFQIRRKGSETWDTAQTLLFDPISNALISLDLPAGEYEYRLTVRTDLGNKAPPVGYEYLDQAPEATTVSSTGSFAIGHRVTVTHHQMDGTRIEHYAQTEISALEYTSFVPTPEEIAGYVPMHYEVGDQPGEFQLDAELLITGPVSIRIYYASTMISVSIPTQNLNFRVDEYTANQVESGDYTFTNGSELQVEVKFLSMQVTNSDEVIFVKNATLDNEIHLNFVPSSGAGTNAFSTGAYNVGPGEVYDTVLGTMDGTCGTGAKAGALTITGQYVGALPVHPYRPELQLSMAFVLQLPTNSEP